MTTHTLRATAAGRAPSLEQGWHYVRRCVEMVAAMVAGMLTLAPVERPVWPELTVRADVGVLMLATSMSSGPAAWMWVRGHWWRDIVETSVLIYPPFVEAVR